MAVWSVFFSPAPTAQNSPFYRFLYPMICGTISWASMFPILGTNLWEEVGLRGWYSVGSLCLRCYRGPVWVGLLGNHQPCKCEVFREELQNNFEWLCKMISSINNLTMIECESKLWMMLVNMQLKKKVLLLNVKSIFFSNFATYCP